MLCLLSVYTMFHHRSILLQEDIGFIKGCLQENPLAASCIHAGHNLRNRHSGSHSCMMLVPVAQHLPGTTVSRLCLLGWKSGRCFVWLGPIFVVLLASHVYSYSLSCLPQVPRLSLLLMQPLLWFIVTVTHGVLTDLLVLSVFLLM